MWRRVVAGLELGAHVEHGLCCDFDSCLRTVYGGYRLIWLGILREFWPRVVVVDDVFGVADIAFQSATYKAGPGVLHGAGQNAELVYATTVHVKRGVGDDNVFHETQRKEISTFGTGFRNQYVA